MQDKMGRESVLKTFASLFPGKPCAYQAPGRINIIGEHTDYNGGLVMPATVDLFTWAAVAPRDDRTMRVYLCDDDRGGQFDLDHIERGSAGDSLEYVKAVAWALSENDIEIGGCDLVISGNIPLGGGLSSSASLELLLAFAWLEQSGIELPAGQQAKICQKAESEFVGVSCGIMDQFIIEQGSCNQAMVLDCNSLDFELTDMPERAVFLIVHSGVKRKLPAGLYNVRGQECEQAVSCLRVARPGLLHLCELNSDELHMNAGFLNDTLYRRARHAVTENSRVRQAVAAMEEDDLAHLGRLISSSHDSLRDDFEVSCRELDYLVKLLRSCEGVLGARMMGAGFGGCTISLVEKDKAASVAQQINSEYGKILGADPWMHVVGPADAVRRLD